MGLAPFFDKNAIAGAQLLRGYDKDSFISGLVRRPPQVVFDGRAVGTPILRLALELLVNLLARLYPTVGLEAADEAARAHQPRLVELARSINSNIEFITSKSAGIRLAVGTSTPQRRSEGTTLFVGANGWKGVLSREGPIASSEEANPFGAGIAACLAAANAFRCTFHDQLERAELDGDVAMSCAGIVPDRDVPSVSEFDVGTTQLVGAGAVGQGALWALGHLNSRGLFEIIDPELIELSNLQRYILTSLRDVGRPKTSFAESLGGLEVRQHRCSWGEFVESIQGAPLRRVLVAVDSAEARCAIQAALPKRILNAWTQPLNLGVSRHSLDEDAACLMCLYFPKRDLKSRDEHVREALHLPPTATLEIRRLLARNEPLSADFIARVAAANGREVDLLRSFVGKTLNQFYSEAVCGSLLLRVPTGSEVQTPMAFQSALAGILLAAELVLEACGARRPPTRSTLNLLRPVAKQETSSMDAKHPSGTCICQDRDYLAAYHRRSNPVG